MRYAILIVLTVSLTAGCSNVVRSGLLNSNSIMMPPGMERTIYVHTGNISENQQVSLNGLSSQLSTKGYQVVKDPAQAHYWLQAHVVYCHKAKAGVSAESVAQTGFGAGIGSGGSAMAAGGFMFGASGGQQQMPDINAMMSMAMASGMGGIRPPPSEGVLYMCVADVLVTEQAGSGQSPKPVVVSNSKDATYTMRSVAHVLQKELNIQEATPIIQEKLTIGIAGLF